MASFGHVAAGLLAARLHGRRKPADDGPKTGDGGGPEPRPRPSPWWTLLLFSGLALLPDADVLLVALGACDTGVCGHRGASHSFPVAIAIGLIAAVFGRRLGWPAIRTGVAVACAVASHAVLDLLGDGGRGLPLLWPFSDERFISPIRPFQDAPRGLALLSAPGIVNVVTELLIFSPVMLYAVWPRLMAWRRARARANRIPQLNITFETLGGVRTSRGELGQAEPDLAHAMTVIEGGAPLPPAPDAAPAATANEGEPSVRSAG